jgi:hypothetical protein
MYKIFIKLLICKLAQNTKVSLSHFYHLDCLKSLAIAFSSIALVLFRLLAAMAQKYAAFCRECASAIYLCYLSRIMNL